MAQTFAILSAVMKNPIIFYPHIGEYGGVERCVLVLAAEARRRGQSPILLCFYDRVGMRQFDRDLNVVEIGDHWNPVAKALRVRRWLEGRADETRGHPLFFGCKAGFYAALSRFRPYALHYTDPPSLLTPTRYRSKLVKLILAPKRRASACLTSAGVRGAAVRMTMTRWNAVELAALYGYPFDVDYLGGGLPPKSRINVEPRCAGRAVRLFSISRIAESKNLDWILDTCTFLRSSTSPAGPFESLTAVIAGTGPATAHLKSRAMELGLGDTVRFPGFLTAEEVESEFSKADLFLVPGRQGYGLPVLEALYRRVPVVVNRESRISEILDSNPWVAVAENSSDSFCCNVARHLHSLHDAYPGPESLADLPTEEVWASEIGRRCGWW